MKKYSSHLAKFFSILCLLFTLPCFAAEYVRSIPINCENANLFTKKFKANLLQLMETWHVPGAAITVMENNKTLLACGIGWANVEERQPVQPRSLFRIGSVSKTITALTILQLIQQNKLHLDDKAFSILADLKPLNRSSEFTDQNIKQITIKNLLQMSSGWSTDKPEDYDPTTGPWSSEMLKQLNYQVPPDCQTAIRLMLQQPLQFTPGTKFSYSNIGYCILGSIINRITQAEGGYETSIKQNIFTPLGITDMQLGDTQYEKRAPAEVKYYYSADDNTFKDIDRILDGLPYSQTEILKKNFSAGGWIASAPSLAKLLQAFHQGKILNVTMKEAMLSKPTYSKATSGYPAMGWDEIDTLNEQNYFIKTGSFTGTQAFIMQSEKGRSYVVLFNAKPSNRAEVIKKLQELFLSKD